MLLKKATLGWMRFHCVPLSRLGWRVASGIIIEVLTLVEVMVTLATNKFRIVAYALAVLGIVIPLMLSTWGIWLFARDEARSREELREKEKRLPASLTKEQQPSLPSPQVEASPTPTRELVYV
jgi:hypothetical protein